METASVVADTTLPHAAGPPELWTWALGVRPYAEVLELQRQVARARIAGEIAQDMLLLVEHSPVVTLGRTAKPEHLLLSADALAARGIELFEVERGGDVTYHGPGQLVGYPIIDLKRHRQDLHWYLRQVEEVLIRALARWDIRAERNPGLTGVWTQDRKIASIGIHARDWVTWHGFALNVTTEPAAFDVIVPCGIAGVEMTSMAREAGRPVAIWEVTVAVRQAFADVFGLIAVEYSESGVNRMALASCSLRSAPTP
ncbi:MAG TPA: lipoyl(octanoyl) transferase LipB [Gemmatimonadaceae bacterium]|nr:lipoyl(octanoyl) transferase LipB [Gemmatimonadaceae bacterium]